MSTADVQSRERRFTVAIFGAGFLFAWVMSSARFMEFVNWDNGVFVAEFAKGRQSWTDWSPWNAHFAIQNAYWPGVWIVRPFGGTLIDGFRLATALFYGVAAAVIGDGARRLSGSYVAGALLALAWMTAWVNFFLVLSLEDNILFLPTAAGVMWLCALRVDTWKTRHSLIAGALAAGAALMSWQALLYVAPAFYAALVGGTRERRPAVRARDGALVLVAFVATLVAWILFIAATSRTQTVGGLLRTLFGRPSGRFDIRNIRDALGALHAIGVAAGFMLEHTAMDLRPMPISPELAGVLFSLVILALLAVATRLSWRDKTWAPHVLAATLALFTLVTPIYVDVDYRYLIRFDFLPLVTAYLAAIGFRKLATPRARHVALAAIALVIVTQSALAARDIHRRRASYPTLATWNGAHPKPAFYGREGKPWYAYFRTLRREHPHACRFVLAQGEVSEGSWNLDLMGSLWSELPTHLVVGDTTYMRRFRYPPHMSLPVDAARFLDDGCSYVSDDARRLITGVKP